MESKLTTTDQWWSDLKVSEKERIASKITKKNISYPECTEVWKGLAEERKKNIMTHVSDKHGHLLVNWNEGFPLTD